VYIEQGVYGTRLWHSARTYWHHDANVSSPWSVLTWTNCSCCLWLYSQRRSCIRQTARLVIISFYTQKNVLTFQFIMLIIIGLIVLNYCYFVKR